MRSAEIVACKQIRTIVMTHTVIGGFVNNSSVPSTLFYNLLKLNITIRHCLRHWVKITTTIIITMSGQVSTQTII